MSAGTVSVPAELLAKVRLHMQATIVYWERLGYESSGGAAEYFEQKHREAMEDYSTVVDLLSGGES